MNHSILRKILPFIILSSALFVGFAQNKYQTYDEMTGLLEGITSAHKDIAELESIGKTPGNRDIWVVKVGKERKDNPAVLIAGGVEADRLIGSELSLRFIGFLLDNYGKVDSITDLVNGTTFYVLPRVNPDASELFFRKPLYSTSLNGLPADDDRDGRTDEDGFEDIDGDGMITMMRVRDNRGEWIPLTDDPRIMKKADASKGETGMYKLFTEGIDNDNDELWNEDGPGGIDFNRNFAHNYTFFGPGAGQYQISGPETRAVADFCFSHPNIAVVFSFSSNDNLMNPWKKEQREGLPQREQRSQRRRGTMEEDETAPRFITSVAEGDEKIFSYVSQHYQELTKFKGAPQSAKGEGAFNEWAYYHYGRWSFSANPWWIPEAEAQKDTAPSDTIGKMKVEKAAKGTDKKDDIKKEKPGEDKTAEITEQTKALKWLDSNGMKEGFIPWKPVKHTDFPEDEAEIGGFKPYIMINPPSDSIDVLASKGNRFLAWLGAKLPRIIIRNIKVEPIDGKVFRLTADIANIGYLPTNSALGDRLRLPRNVKAELGLSKDQLIASGREKTVLGPIAGGGGREEISWLIVSKPGTTVILTVESPTAGRASQTITLK